MRDLDAQRLAVDLGKCSKSEAPRKPMVGVVIVKDGDVLGQSYRGRTGSGEHAEYGLVKELTDARIDLSGSLAYTTLEPCSSRNLPKIPCATRLIEAGVSEVVIGMYDPNPRIFRDGWRMLCDAGVKLREFSREYRAEIRADNQEFTDQYLRREADRDTGVLFDWDQHPAGFSVVTSGGEFRVRFTRSGPDSLHLVGEKGTIGYARYARAFDEIDDPLAQDSWETHTRTIHELEIGIIKAPHGFLLVKVNTVWDKERQAEQNCVCFDFEYRPE